MKHSRWLKSGISGYFKKRRFNTLDKMCGNKLTAPKGKVRILDVGCAQGKDLLQFITNPDVEIYGIDIKEYEMINKSTNFIIGDACDMDFEDDFFDVTFSVGVLEHIQPINKLDQMINEINRVSKEFYMMMPSITTPYEPHAHQFFWGLRRKRKHHPWLMFFDDRTWLKFEGFSEAWTKRFWYIPGLIQNIIIYKNKDAIKKASVEFKIWEKYRY